ncbi:MAG: radical SAM/SPASM domain-containing protein [Candidatus Aenigmatarchaeota archaeon]
MQVWPTNKCNLHCKFCWRERSETSKWKNIEEIDSDLLMNAIHEGLDLSLERLTVSGGGEPLLRREVLERIIELSSEYDTETNVVTNGTLFDRELFIKMIENSWDSISFSIHSFVNENSSYITGSEVSLDKTLDNLRLVNDLKREYNSEKPRLFSITVINKWNWKNIEEFIKIAEKNGFDSVSFKIPEGDESIGEMFIENKNKEKLIEKIRKIKSRKFRDKFELGINLEFSIEDIVNYYNGDGAGSEEVKRIKSCDKPFNEIDIFADGRVAQCCNFGFSEDVVGRLTWNKSLKDIWYGEKMNRIRRDMENGIFHERCKDCFPTTKAGTGEDK